MLLVEALNPFLVGGKDDVVIVKSNLGNRSRQRHTTSKRWSCEDEASEFFFLQLIVKR